MNSEEREYESIFNELKKLCRPEAAEGMARFGIKSTNVYGVSIPNLRRMARKIGRNHSLAQPLWSSAIHEARILASMIDDPDQVTEKQMDCWIKDFDSWDLCDQCCMNLFRKTSVAWKKAIEWAEERTGEFERHAGFALMACLAWYDKESSDEDFLSFLTVIEQGADDERNYVKKAVNWALRNIGKRNQYLNRRAIETAAKIAKTDSRSAKWIAADAIRELTSDAVKGRLDMIRDAEEVSR